MPRRRGTGKGAKVRYEVRERASVCPIRSSSQIASHILSQTMVNPRRLNSHVQDYPWSPGIPHGIHFRTSNSQRATRPRLQVSPTAMLYAPLSIRLHNLGCPTLEQTAG